MTDATAPTDPTTPAEGMDPSQTSSTPPPVVDPATPVTPTDEATPSDAPTDAPSEPTAPAEPAAPVDVETVPAPADTNPPETPEEEAAEEAAEDEPAPASESVDKDGNTVETPPDLGVEGHVLPVQDDPDAAQFAGGTAHSDSEDPPEPPEHATGDTVATGHRDDTTDDTVSENVPEPPADLPAQWGDLRAQVDRIEGQVAELHELVMVAAPAVRKVSEDVSKGGLAALMGSVFGMGRKS